MTFPLKHTWITSFLFLGLACVLFYAGLLFQEKTSLLDHRNQQYQSLLKRLKTVHFPEQFISLLDNPSQEKGEDLLSHNAEAHYISLENLNTSVDLAGLKTIEITFSAELDTDVFDYLKNVNHHYKSTLALKEVGLFREDAGITGKMTFKVYEDSKEKKENTNE
jgi:hypothetical protein